MQIGPLPASPLTPYRVHVDEFEFTVHRENRNKHMVQYGLGQIPLSF